MRKRNNRIWTRLTDDELSIVTSRVKRTGVSREAYTRSVLLGSVPREKPDERFYAVMRSLSGIANNANQLARKAVATGYFHAKELQEEAEKWGKFQLEVRQKFLLPEKLE